jgi:hypothetical protein
MGAVAASAIFFALLPTPFAVALTVAVCGVVVLDGMRLPVVTEGNGAWRWLPWMIWLLALLGCPIATRVVEFYRSVGAPGFCGPLATLQLVDGLVLAHLAIFVVASIAVVVLTRGPRRWLAWTAMVVIGIVAFIFIERFWGTPTFGAFPTPPIGEIE